ncbi:Sorting nexin-13 [Nymphon striatum]|nr:Sorting nexin-13 [Nymphon striatum]
MFKWAEQYVTGITFFFISADDVVKNAESFGLDARYSVSKTVTGTRSHHSFVPVSVDEIQMRRVSADENFSYVFIGTPQASIECKCFFKNVQFDGICKISFPGKKAFNNMNKSFLQKRMLLLKDYLLAIQSPYVEDIVKPLKTVKEVVMNVPDNLVDGVVGVKAGLSRALNMKKQSSHLDEQSGKVGAALLYPENFSDNIPLRIMLLLMDEVFDLKSRNLWLRRRIITLLRQIIKATYEDMINRKIIDYVQWMLSAEQVSEYIRSFKESFWPNGILAAPNPERDNNTKMRTRVAAKVAMMCVFSDELKHVIGSETFRKGIMCIFEMFQNKTLNKRLIYVLLEGVLATLFYSNNFKETFQKLHSHFQKIKKKTMK